MNEHNDGEQAAFEGLQQHARIARMSRMLKEDVRLSPNQRKDIIERCLQFIAETDYTQAAIARELDMSSTTISELLRDRWKGKTGDQHLARINNWLELTARRDSIVRSREFVETSVAEEILMVAGTVAETCKMGVVFGPSHIGKSFTLKAIEGDQRYGCPVVITVEDWLVRPIPLCRQLCRRFDLSTHGTFDALANRIVDRLKGTKRMVVFDEADLLAYRSIETIRHIHDATECPVLFCGKPKIYERLGFRSLGEFSEVTDQLASRIVMKRDLTERTRSEDSQPLFTKEDIRKLIDQSGLQLKVSDDAVKWMQERASTLGMGGIGKAMFTLYLAAKVAYARGDVTITADCLAQVDGLTMGHEDASRISDVVADSSGMRRVV